MFLGWGFLTSGLFEWFLVLILEVEGVLGVTLLDEIIFWIRFPRSQKSPLLM